MSGGGLNQATYERLCQLVDAHKGRLQQYGKAVDAVNRKPKIRTIRAVSAAVRREDELRQRSVNDVIAQFEDSTRGRINAADLIDPEVNPYAKAWLALSSRLNRPKSR